jgi:hypothetical protein
MKDTIKKLPKWFNGDVYTEGGTVENPFSGEQYSLDSSELSMYDFIKGLEYVGNHRGWDDEMISLMHKGLDWFRAANPQAYMVLLD